MIEAPRQSRRQIVIRRAEDEEDVPAGSSRYLEPAGAASSAGSTRQTDTSCSSSVACAEMSGQKTTETTALRSLRLPGHEEASESAYAVREGHDLADGGDALRLGVLVHCKGV